MKGAATLKARRKWARARKGVALEDRAITLQTRSRYFNAVRKVMHLLESPGLDIDQKLYAWIQDAYEDGECVTYVGDMLSGLHHFAPWLRGELKSSWRLFRLWRRVEKPAQAPPLPEGIVVAMVGRCLELGQLDMAVAICLGFWGLLRTGELLQLTPAQVMLGGSDGVIQLGYTKTGLRKVQDENVVLQHRGTLLLCQTWKEIRMMERTMHLPILLDQGPGFRKAFKSLIDYFHLTQPFRPYSLRRGGATADFRAHGSMERTLIKGRWGSNHAARQYIQEGLSVLTTITLSKSQIQLLKHYAKIFIPFSSP